MEIERTWVQVCKQIAVHLRMYVHVQTRYLKQFSFCMDWSNSTSSAFVMSTTLMGFRDCAQMYVCRYVHVYVSMCAYVSDNMCTYVYTINT